MPPMQFQWLGASYDPARQVIELFRYGGGYELITQTLLATRLQAPPDILVRSMVMGGTLTSNPSAQVAMAMYYERRLTHEEMRLIVTGYVPPVFIHGKFPFHFTDVPRTCPSGGATFDFTLYLPHTYGGAVTVNITTPTGVVTPASLVWDTPNTLERNRKVGLTFKCKCAAEGTTTFNFELFGDTEHYWLPKTSFQVTQLDPSAVAVFRLNPAAIAPPNATLEPAYNTVSFDGWSQFLGQYPNFDSRCDWSRLMGLASGSSP